MRWPLLVCSGTGQLLSKMVEGKTLRSTTPSPKVRWWVRHMQKHVNRALLSQVGDTTRPFSVGNVDGRQHGDARWHSATKQQRAARSEGQSLRVSGGITVAEGAALGHVVHWLDLLAISWLCESESDLCPFVWRRQQVPADRLCGIPKKSCPSGSEHYRGLFGLRGTRHVVGNHDASDERCSFGTCYPLDGQRGVAQTGKWLRGTSAEPPPPPRRTCGTLLWTTNKFSASCER